MMAITPNAQANDDSNRIYKTASNTIEIKQEKEQKLPDSLLQSFEETQGKK